MATLSKTVTRTIVENQGETEFCWLFSLANAIVSSLWVRLDTVRFYNIRSLFGLKRKATDFLNRKDLRQKLRRELSFGLFPKTLIGKFWIINFEIIFVLAGEEQRHFVHNAFNVLINEGFLRDQQGRVSGKNRLFRLKLWLYCIAYTHENFTGPYRTSMGSFFPIV